MKKNYSKKTRIVQIAGLILACVFFASCSSEPAKISPMPALHTSLNATDELPKEEVVKEQVVLTVNEIELASPVEELKNRGSNTENNGIAAEHDGTIYYIYNGLNSIAPSGNHAKKILDRTDILYINIYGEYLYFVCSEDYTVCRMPLDLSAEAEKIDISGAYSMMIMQDHIYYQNAVGSEADNYLYRAHLDGSEKENLMIKASSYTFDGQTIYYANEEEDGMLYSYDTCTGENLQISNNQASQINIINGKVYYINRTTKNLTMLDTQTLESTVVFQDDISYLNSTGNLLVFYFIDTGVLGTMSTITEEINYILEYNDVNGLNVADEWIFFESYENTASEEVFFLKTDGTELSRELPVMTLAKVVDYSFETKTIYLDYVRYFEGELALSEYIHDYGVSERRAKEVLEETDGVYIQNSNPNVIAYKFSDTTDIMLNINLDSSYDLEGYSTDIANFEELLQKDASLIYDQLYNIIGFDSRLIKIHQFYNP